MLTEMYIVQEQGQQSNNQLLSIYRWLITCQLYLTSKKDWNYGSDGEKLMTMKIL